MNELLKKVSEFLAHNKGLPVLIGIVGGLGENVRFYRTLMLDEMYRDYVRTAYAKGLRYRPVVLRHGLRNALIPIATIIGTYIPNLLAGAVFIETIFTWPGMGRLFVESVNARDYPVVMGLTLILAIIILTANLLTDLTYALIDPRIRYE